MNSLSRRLSLEGQMRAILVVFGFPRLQFSRQFFVMPKVLLRVCFVAPLHFAVHLRTSGRDAAVGNAEIGKMPGELRSERRVVIRQDSLDGEGKMLTNFLEEIDGSLSVVVVVAA
jgi:hypothetical protein